MIRRLQEQWFFAGLIIVFAGVVLDQTGTAAAAGNYFKVRHGSDIVIFLIFIMSGMMIETEEIRSGIKDISATFLALFVILVISPSAAYVLSLFPLQKDLVIGLFIIAAMPTTLSSGVVMTREAGGNMAHALFVTVFSNSISFISVPLILSWLLSSSFAGQDIRIDQIMIVKRLFVLVLLPLAIGLTSKFFLFRIEAETKKRLQIMNQIFVLCIVFMAASGSREIFSSSYRQCFIIVLVVTVFHLILLFCSFYGIKLLKIGPERYESVIFMGSQKTLPLSVIIQITYFSTYPAALFVCVVHHFIHLMIDGYISSKLKMKTCKNIA